MTQERSEAGTTTFAGTVEPASKNSDKRITLRGLVDFGPDFWNRPPPSEDWVAKPIIAAGRQTGIWSPAKAGKSLLVLDGVVALATGRPVFGQRPVDPVVVLYFDMEMTNDDLFERLTSMGYGPDDALKDHLVYYQLSNLPMLDTPEGGDVVAQLVAQHGAGVVVLDTMARIVNGGENEADTYRRFYNYTGKRLKELGCPLLRLDHGGKDLSLGQRGSSAKVDDLDLVYRLGVVGRQRTLTRTHVRMSWVAKSYVFNESGGPNDPPFTHVLQTSPWTVKGKELAKRLDKLGVPLDASRTTANQALTTDPDGDGKGRRGSLVDEALDYRKSLAGGEVSE
ncbi:MAG: AAA family ATPase [Acidimicrobiales bacterium]